MEIKVRLKLKIHLHAMSLPPGYLLVKIMALDYTSASGEYGVVYQGSLKRLNDGFSETVAVKTLKGINKRSYICIYTCS